MINWTDEQLRAIQHSGNILISASAGSGKTTVLVERVLNNIINKHIPINRMLVLTFTDLASQEMKEKITDKLIEKAKEGGENAKLLKEQISLIPFSQISTIHSFCMEIARSYFDFLKINPTFDMLNDMDVELYKLKAFNNVIDRLTREENSQIDFRLLINVLTDNRKLDEFYNIIKIMHENTQTQVDKQFLANQVSDMYSKEGFVKIKSVIVEDYLSQFNEVYNTLLLLQNNAKENLEYVNTMLDRIEVFRKDSSLESLVNYAQNDSFTKRLNKSKSTEGDEFIKKLENAKNTVKGLVDGLKSFAPYSEQVKMYFATEPVIKNLVLFTNEFIKEYQTLKKRDSKLDFNDLETYAIKVLDNDDLLQEIKDRYDAIFIDEYQDTNPIQEHIINKVAKDECFYVGDLKQSIYGFRLCDPKIIKNRYNLYKNENKGEAIDLNCNFRSSAKIIDFVNRIFDVIMTEQSSMVDYKNTSELVKGGETIKEKIEKNEDCKIVLFEGIQKEEREYSGVYDIVKDEIVDKESEQDLEAEYMINEINSLVGSYKIGDRYCTYSDIAILVQAKSHFSEIAKRMEKFVPLNLVDFEQDLSKQDIDTINDVLSLAINFNQDKPLARSLLSYFGGLSEQNLADIRIQYPDVTFYEAVKKYGEEQNDAVSEQIAKFIKLLDTVRFTSSFKETPTVFRNLIAGGFDSYITSLKDGEKRLENLNNYIIELTNNNRLYNIIDYLEYTKTNNIITKTTASKSRDAVQVMTIHKSKGLEFPIVFIPELHKQFNIDSIKSPFLYNSNVGAGIYYYDTKNYIKRETLSRLAVKQYILNEEKMESIRLFYVALTRAKQKLYLLAVDKKLKEKVEVKECNSYLDMLKIAINNDNMLYSTVQTVENVILNEQKKSEFKFTKPNSKYVKAIQSAIDFRYPHLEATKMLVQHSATSINKIEEQSYKITDEKTSAKTGIIYHKVMQYIDFNCYTLQEVEQELDKMVESGILQPEEKEVVDSKIIFKVLNLDIINIASRNKHFREKEFLIRADSKKMGISNESEKIIIQGVIDLLIVGDTSYLVDYKYSSKSDEELANLYEKQFYVYETAYKTLFGADIDKKVIVNLKKGTQVYIK